MYIGEKYLLEFKTSLRITTKHFDDTEIIPLIDAALADMAGVGVEADIENPLHRLTVKHFLKAYFGENPNRADWVEAYENLRDALAMRSVQENE